MTASANVRQHVLVWLALLVLAGMSCIAAYFVHGALAVIVGPVFAVMQAALIAAFFMDALSGSRLIRVCIFSGVLWLFLMLSLTLVDYLTRGWIDPTGK
jgi:cytochrome c oxidase subunit IV